MSDRSLHVLLVDDDEASRSTICEYLKSLGYEKVTQAKDGAEAALILDRDPTVGFVISDWEMPTMSGIALLQRVRASPTRSNIPFLIVTSPISAEAEKVMLAAESYVDSYIIKPFRSQVLEEKIDSILKKSAHGPQKRVVVVDDDSDSRSMIVDYLRALGFKDIAECTNGQQALSLLLNEPKEIGLIISDWEMPTMSGIELLRACKASPLLEDVPFLMVTSQGSMERLKIVLAARSQVDHYLLKPFQLVDLKGRIDALLNRARTRREVLTHLEAATNDFEHGRYESAQRRYDLILTLDAENDAALRGMGETLLKVKGVESALPFLKKAIEVNPFHVRGYLRLSQAYEQSGLPDRAIALLQSAIAQISFSSELHFHLGRLYNRKGQVSLAKVQFEKTLEIQLDHQEARLMIAMLKGSKDKD